MRIHVTGEARHIRIRQDGLRKAVPTMPPYRRMMPSLRRQPVPWSCSLCRSRYHRAGLDGAGCAAPPGANPNFHRACVTSFAPLAYVLREVGLMGRVGRRMWRRAGFL